MALDTLRSAISSRPRIFSNSGSPDAPVYSGSFDDDGVFTLKVSGMRNINAEIQVYEPSCNIEFILQRYSAGDVAALDRAAGFYGDVSKLPKNLSEMLNLIQNGKSLFEKLPGDIKQKFNNSFEQYIATAGTEEWFTKLSRPKPAAASKVSGKVSDSSVNLSDSSVKADSVVQKGVEA